MDKVSLASQVTCLFNVLAHDVSLFWLFVTVPGVLVLTDLQFVRLDDLTVPDLAFLDVVRVTFLALKVKETILRGNKHFLIRLQNTFTKPFMSLFNF